MGLMLSVLIGCVGLLELLSCVRHVTDGVIITINKPATPCLSYHEPFNDNMSIHDSICSYSHSGDANLPSSAKHKLENLHEYSLRIRAELRSLDKSLDYNLSEFGSRDLLLGSRSPDSRLSPDFNYLVQVSEQEDQPEEDCRKQYERETSYEDAADNWHLESSSRPLTVITEPERYIRVPTPIPFSLDDDVSSSGDSSDVGTSFDNDSGNEAPTMKSLDSIPVIKRYKSPSDGGESSIEESDGEHSRKLPRKLFRKSKSPEPRSQEAFNERSKSTENLLSSEKLEVTEQSEAARVPSQKKKIKSSSTIVRKSTKLKSKNAEVSKSAENLTARKSKRHREPERRKSDISVQTTSGFLRDEWTNTSPPESPILSRSDSRKNVSVQVQTSFEDELASLEPLTKLKGSAIGLSESRRDLSSRDRFGRKSFKNRRFGSGSRVDVDDDASIDDCRDSNVTSSVERYKDEVRLLKISSFEEADDEDYERIRSILTTDSDPNERRRNRSRPVSSFEDEEYWDAEDVSARARPIEYSIPDPDRNKAFWIFFKRNRSQTERDTHSLNFPFVWNPRTESPLFLISPSVK